MHVIIIFFQFWRGFLPQRASIASFETEMTSLEAGENNSTSLYVLHTYVDHPTFNSFAWLLFNEFVTSFSQKLEPVAPNEFNNDVLGIADITSFHREISWWAQLAWSDSCAQVGRAPQDRRVAIACVRDSVGQEFMTMWS